MIIFYIGNKKNIKKKITFGKTHTKIKEHVIGHRVFVDDVFAVVLSDNRF